MGDDARPPAESDPIIRPIFDGRIKTQRIQCNSNLGPSGYKSNTLPITRRQILDSSKLKEFADGNFKFDENGRELSTQVENTVGKGEIACNEQFLLFPQCLQRTCFQGESKGVMCGNRLTTVHTGHHFNMTEIHDTVKVFARQSRKKG